MLWNNFIGIIIIIIIIIIWRCFVSLVKFS